MSTNIIGGYFGKCKTKVPTAENVVYILQLLMYIFLLPNGYCISRKIDIRGTDTKYLRFTTRIAYSRDELQPPGAALGEGEPRQ